MEKDIKKEEDKEKEKEKKIEKKECTIEYPYELIRSGECIKVCNATDFFNYICRINNKDSTVKNNMIKAIKKEILNGNLDNLLSKLMNDKKEDLIVIEEDIIYTLTNTDNQEKNKNKNISTINLGECENELKKQYKIDNIEPLLIFKIDVLDKDLNYPFIEYEVYNYKTKEKLNMNYCKDIKININFPVNIDENNEFKYDPSSKYYNDICYTYTTENGTDIILDDRKNEFLKNNMSLCESTCDYERYNSETKKASCNCEIKIKIPFISEIVINKDLLRSKFVNIKNYINLNVMKCFKVLFSNEGL